MTKALLLVTVVAIFISCKDENSQIFEKTALSAMTNMQAYSRSATSVGLQWSSPSDTSRKEFKEITELQVRVRTPDNLVLYTYSVPKVLRDTAVTGLDEGKIYTFEVVSIPSATSNDYKESGPVTIRWAPARRMLTEGPIPIDVYEIRSTLGGSGLQFFDGGSLGPRVLSIGVGPAQQVIDVLVDTNASGDIILESAHRNPLLVGQARRTRFSTIEFDASDLNVARAVPPDTTSYIRDNVLVFPNMVQNGKILYAVTNDKNYVRLLVLRDATSGTLLFGTRPNRRVRVQLSYQTLPNVIYVKPNKQHDQSSN